MKISQNLKNYIEQYNTTREYSYIFIGERQRKIDFYSMIELVEFDPNRTYRVWGCTDFKDITPDMSNIDIDAAKKEALNLAKKAIEQEKWEINKMMYSEIIKRSVYVDC